ncbi:heme peroxidase [Tothia fuscella]|uniref:Peroxidase n=1 Tax=Tothia fuscella TaxID=1048955 RepID=A0A9P4NVB5_9PEZI|nr:heme peroxidase [Tothia fuscella]
MLFSTSSVALIALVSSTQAFSLAPVSTVFKRHWPSGQRGYEKRQNGTACPAVWSQISHDLTTMFLSNGVCNDDARAAIRAVFHDCFPGEGCDGSLALPEELARHDNQPMAATVTKFKALADKYDVGIADMIAFAGSHAVVTCPQGPIVTTYIGRDDASVPAPEGQLPAASVGGDDALKHFSAKGFTAQDLAALIGAHTASRQFNTDTTNVGEAQDTTPGIWDIVYYVQTLLRQAPLSFQSDINLANQNQVGPWMKKFSTDKAGWDAAFSAAMTKMELLGTDGPGAMVDCTSALPRAHVARYAKSAPINARTY